MSNSHLKRYSVLDELKKSLKDKMHTSPGVGVLEDGTVYYDNELKKLYPQYRIMQGVFDWDNFDIYERPNNYDPYHEDEPEENPTIFSIDKEFEYIYLDGGTISLNITSNKPWECEYDSRYISISPNSANGNKSINILIYSTKYSRDLSIDFYVENKKVDTFIIYQYAYEDMPLTFDILEDGDIGWNPYSYNKQIKYNINGKSWQQITTGTISVKNGDKLYFIGDNNSYSAGSPSYSYFSSTCNINIYGNIMSLINSTIFNTLNTITNTYCFYGLFYTLKVINAKDLILPATTLATECYCQMFSGCTNLTTAPELPATTLANSCYKNMFNGCTSLTTAPELPATTLATGCYQNMFNGCTSLTTAPELPATTLAYQCYCWMFQNCTSLNYIKCLATDISAPECLYNWVNGVASSGTFVKNTNMISWSIGTNGIPSGWTVQDAA